MSSVAAKSSTLLPSFRVAQGVCRECGGPVWKWGSKDCRKCYLKQRQTRTKFKPADYIKQFRYYRARFTPEQRARYDEILRYRPLPSVTDQAEAVDWVMREPAPGVCCEACLKRAES